MLQTRALVAMAALAWATPAFATCLTARAVLPTVDPDAPPTQRFEQLHARAGWVDSDTDAAAWQALVADLDRDPASPSRLRAIAHIELAAALEDDSKALAAAVEAERIARTNGLAGDPAWSHILSVLIYKQIDAGHAQAAEPYAEPALAAARASFGERSSEWGEANSAVSSLRYAQGRYDEAVAYQQVRRDALLACLPPDDSRIGDAISSHGVLLSSAGRLSEALPEEFDAVRWRSEHEPEGSDRAIGGLGNLGLLLRNVGRLGEAEQVLRRALDLAVRYRAGDALRLSGTLANLALVLAAEGKGEEAEALWARAIDYYRRSGDRSNSLGASGMLRRSADAAQARGDIATALERREAALADMARAPKGHPEVARAQLEYATTLLLAQRVDEAAAVAEPAIAVIRKGMPLVDGRRWGAEVMAARVTAAKDGAEAGYRALAPVADRLEVMMLDPATTRGDLVSYAPLYSGAFELLARLALETGREAEAFHALQMAALSQIVLVTTDMAAREALQDPNTRTLVVGMQDAVRKRRELERARSLAVAASETLAAAQARIDANDTEIRRLVGELDRQYPAYRSVGRPAPATLAAFRARLAPGEVLLAPLSLDGGTYVVTVTRDGLRWGRSNTSAQQVKALAARIRAAIAAGERDARAPFDLAAARGLYDALIPAKLRPVLATHPALLYYAHGVLAELPPALLAAPSRPGAAPAWLIRTHDITVLPTLDRPPPRVALASTATRFLGVGAPVLGRPDRTALRGLAFRGSLVETGALQGLPALSRTHEELLAMQRVIGGRASTVLAGNAANEANVRALPLARFGVLAFATHGLVAGDLPGLSEPALVLTPPLQPSEADDGLLTASEIASLKLNADWVILSACNTASGGSAGNPQYAGLASAFIQAGARALLVSHWPVRDDAAARLTVDTLRETRTAPTRAVALQRAMLKLMADRRVPGAANPAVWAPFVFIGR